MEGNNTFARVNQDMHFLVTLGYAESRVLETFTNTELNIPRNC